MSIEFGDENFSLEGSTFETKFSPKEEKFLTEETEQLLKTGVIKESTYETGEFISPMFLVPKSSDSYRLILNLKKLNAHMPYTHFKMETKNYILTIITPNCYVANLDIIDAYYLLLYSDFRIASKILEIFVWGKALSVYLFAKWSMF